MLFGIHYGPREGSMNIGELARVAEEYGFESLFVSEHTHVPVRIRVPRARGPIPRSHAEGLDPWISLSVAAAATSRIRLGTAVTLVTQRDPIILAREVASLDVYSGGRVILGAGVGSLADETANHGVDPTQRWGVMRERILAMKEIWTHDEAEYHGKFVNFDPILQWPKPVQKPYPPIYIGGSGPHVIRRVVAYGDGWMPTVETAGPDFFERVAALQRLAQDKGRPPVPVTASDAEPDPAILEDYARAGLVRAVFRVPSAGSDEIVPLLQQYRGLITRFA